MPAPKDFTQHLQALRLILASVIDLQLPQTALYRSGSAVVAFLHVSMHGRASMLQDDSCYMRGCACPSPAGGDLALVNLPGYGVDAFLTLRRLDTAGWREQLDTDEAATGSAVAVGAALNMQQQLQRNRVVN